MAEVVVRERSWQMELRTQKTEDRVLQRNKGWPKDCGK